VDDVNDDDSDDEAMRVQAFSHEITHYLRTPSVYKGLGLPHAPVTIRHMDLDDWLNSKRFVRLPGQ
jgi:hypothetical protein